VLCWGWLAVGGSATLVHAANPGAAASAGVFAVVGAGCIISLLVGQRIHRPRPLLPWRLMTVGSVLFLAGALLRPVAVTLDGPGQALGDFFTLPGYGCVVAAFLLFRRSRRSATDVHALTDGVIVGVGALLLAAHFLALPATLLPGRPQWLALTAGLYPVLDVVVMLSVLYLSFSTAIRELAFRLLMAAMWCLLVGDLGYAVLGTQGKLVGPYWVDLPFTVAYTLVGAAALHPSMATLTRAQPRPVQAWSAARLALIIPALGVPALLLFVTGSGSDQTAVRVGTAVAALVMTLALLARAVGAVGAYARSQESFRHQATHDALTGLANRRLLTDRVQQMIERTSGTERQVCLLFLDLDGFKLVNDSWGHDFGDQLLTEVARRLTGAVRAGDVTARIGGDEFVVAAEVGTDDPNAERLAGRLLASFVVPFTLPVAEVVITPSIGIAAAGVPAKSPDDLIRDADTAMYRAKEAGRNRHVVFTEAMRDRVRARVDIELALRHALVREQFALHYQPVVSLPGGQVIGYEALLRWHHPVLGDVSPADFVPVAEDTGLIVAIGEWVLETAAAQLMRWRAEGGAEANSITVAVNVSTRQLRDGRLVDTMARVLHRNQLPPKALHIEITESAMADDTDLAVATLTGLTRLGVEISVDDFGTGYSSLSYLHRFPVSEVKIDRSFVARLCADEGGEEEIVRAILAMAHAMNLTVVAEGIETAEQRDVLGRLGVDRGQGWFYGRPAPADTVRSNPARSSTVAVS